MKYHYSKKEGWLGNPCGLVYFKNRYHLLFQVNPESPRYGRMHWGHAISDDLISWEECPVALSPDEELSCNSGSAVVHDGKIWLFYTSLSFDYTETVCAAYSEDGMSFTRCSQNPVAVMPAGGTKFRDPFVMRYGKGFLMLTGACVEGVAKVLRFESDDLINWRYKGEFLSDSRFGSVIEAPQLIEADGRWVFIIQSEKHLPTKVLFATGDLNGDGFVFDDEKDPFKPVEIGNDLLNPVTFTDREGAAVLMAWMFSTKMNSSAVSIPREISVNRNGGICMIPYGELRNRTVRESSFVSFGAGRLRVHFEGRTLFDKAYRECPEINVIEDVGTVEVFLDGGRETVSVFVC